MTDTLPPLPDSGHHSSGPFGQSVLPWFSADQMRAYAAAAVAALREELTVTDKLLADRRRVIDAIPECPVHGPNCVAHALAWAREAITGTEAAVAAEHASLADLPSEIEGYLTAAADGSMSRNNSETLAAELLQAIRARTPLPLTAIDEAAKRVKAAGMVGLDLDGASRDHPAGVAPQPRTSSAARSFGRFGMDLPTRESPICGNCQHYVRGNAWSGGCSWAKHETSPGVKCPVGQFLPHASITSTPADKEPT